MSKGTGSGVTMRWTGWAKFRGPREQGPPISRQFKKNNYPVTVKMRTSGYQKLECFIATFPTDGCLFHVGETFNRFADNFNYIHRGATEVV